MSASEEDRLLRSHHGLVSDAEFNFLEAGKAATAAEDDDLEIQAGSGRLRNSGFRDLISKIRHFDRSFSDRDRRWEKEGGEMVDSRSSSPSHHRSYSYPHSPSSLDHHHHPLRSAHKSDEETLGDCAPPEWALLLVGCLLGLATGLCVAAFNHGVHLIHEWAWAGTPEEGAAWLRLQMLADTWHRILLIPVTGGVIVGMLHGLVEILDQIRPSSSSERQGFDILSGVFPTIKAIQAAVTLGTGCSLGPEGPSVDIGKSCAHGCSIMMENNRERKIALVAAGAAAGIASELPLYLIWVCYVVL